VKFSAITGNGREATREQHRRGRLAAPALRKRFPAIDSLQLDFAFSDRSEFLPSPQVTVFHPPAPAFFRFACPYSDCSGEFDLTRPVDLAVHGHQPQSRGHLQCTGIRHRSTACTLGLDYSIAPRWP
jgi:hypothetical protein